MKNDKPLQPQSYSAEEILKDFELALYANPNNADSHNKAYSEATAQLNLLLQEAWTQGAEAHNKGYSGKPEKQPVPCNDCGSDYWVDWTLPHPVFNAVCPGGSGYLCLPCFATRMVTKEKLPEGSNLGISPQREAGDNASTPPNYTKKNPKPQERNRT